MRVTTQIMLNNSVTHMQDNLARLSLLQERASSGKKIQDPSEDPALAVSSLNLRSTLRRHEAYLETAQVTRDWLNANETALDQFMSVANRAVDLMRTSLSDTNGIDERTAMSTEMEGLLEQAVQVANTTQRGSYLFAGYKTTQASINPVTNPSGLPFEMVPAPPGGIPTAVNYGGDAGVIQNGIEPNQTMVINLNGQQVVNGDVLLPDFFQRLMDARDELLVNPKNTAALQTAMDNLRTSFDNLTNYRTANGARVRQVDDSIARMQKTDLALKNLLSHQEDADMAETITQLKQQETVYQTVLQVGSQVLPPSLFDFLR